MTEEELLEIEQTIAEGAPDGVPMLISTGRVRRLIAEVRELRAKVPLDTETLWIKARELMKSTNAATP